jgi:ribonuclease VapC
MTEGVLAASAIIALVRREPGADVVAQYLPGALVCAANLSEVMAKTAEQRPDLLQAAWETLMALKMETIPFDIDLARRAGELRAVTRKMGLSFADRACLALAEREGLPAVTADKRWSDLGIGINVKVIR